MSEYNFHVAGTFYHEDVLEPMLTENPEFDDTKADILANHDVDQRVYRYENYVTDDIAFIPEPENPSDPNAIRIEIDGEFVGYVKRGSTGRIRNLLNTPGVTVFATVYGGPCREVYIDDYGHENLRYLETPYEATYTFRTAGTQSAGTSQRSYAQQTSSGGSSYSRYRDAAPQPSAVYCPRCGVPASPQGYCPKCGSYVGGGQPSAVPVKQLREINKWIAALLCFFLGCMGAHKFYEGKIGMGILYLFTVGLLGIGALVDFIVILTKPDPYYV